MSFCQSWSFAFLAVAIGRRHPFPAYNQTVDAFVQRLGRPLRCRYMQAP